MSLLSKQTMRKQQGGVRPLEGLLTLAFKLPSLVRECLSGTSVNVCTQPTTIVQDNIQLQYALLRIVCQQFIHYEFNPTIYRIQIINIVSKVLDISKHDELNNMLDIILRSLQDQPIGPVNIHTQTQKIHQRAVQNASRSLARANSGNSWYTNNSMNGMRTIGAPPPPPEDFEKYIKATLDIVTKCKYRTVIFEDIFKHPMLVLVVDDGKLENHINRVIEERNVNGIPGIPSISVTPLPTPGQGQVQQAQAITQDHGQQAQALTQGQVQPALFPTPGRVQQAQAVTQANRLSRASSMNSTSSFGSELTDPNFNNVKYPELTIKNQEFHYMHTNPLYEKAEVKFELNDFSESFDVFYLPGQTMQENAEGGKPKSEKVKVLGRVRKVIKEGRRKFVMVKGTKMSLTEARRLEKQKRS